MSETTQTEIRQAIEDQAPGLVVTYRTWRGDSGTARVYLTLRGYDRTWRGCATSQVYIDAAGQLIIGSAKGLAPREYDESIAALRAIAASL